MQQQDVTPRSRPNPAKVRRGCVFIAEELNRKPVMTPEGTKAIS
jgi:hypothetical protein